jgi:hypothetical protein
MVFKKKFYYENLLYKNLASLAVPGEPGGQKRLGALCARLCALMKKVIRLAGGLARVHACGSG